MGDLRLDLKTTTKKNGVTYLISTVKLGDMLENFDQLLGSLFELFGEEEKAERLSSGLKYETLV